MRYNFNMISKTLLIGYGNPDRGDDGAAWHILKRLFIDEGLPETDLFTSDLVSLTPSVDVWFNFQLLPEYADIISTYPRAVFIDAHTGEIKDDLNFTPIKPEFGYSPFTHHLTPQSLLAITESITGKFPQSWMVSVRGFLFKFDNTLSPETEALCNQAIKLIKTNFLN